jgi:hypothetical protein
MKGLSESPIDRKKSLDSRIVRVVQVMPTEPIEIDWNRAGIQKTDDYDCRAQNSAKVAESAEVRSLPHHTTDRQIKHYGLDRSRQKLVNGRIIQDSKVGTSADPFTGWQAQTVPSFFELMCCLSLQVSHESLALLETLGYEKTFLDTLSIGDLVTARKLLKKHPFAYTERGSLWEQLPTSIRITPKICLTTAIVCSMLLPKQGDPLVSKFLRSLVWNKQPSNKVRIEVDIYHTETSARFAIGRVKPIARNRVVGEVKKIAASSKTRFTEATNETAKQLNEARLNYDTRYIHGTIEIVLSPSNNRGKHICAVTAIDLNSGRIIPLGTIRHKDGKLFYVFKDILAGDGDRQALEGALKKRSIAPGKMAAEIADTKAKISAKNREIEEMKGKIKTVRDLALTKKLEALRIELKQLHADLASLSSPNNADHIRQNLQKFDQSLLFPIVSALSSLGLQFNHWVRCIPSQSPLSSPRYWADKFGVLVCYDDDQIKANKPIEFVKDLRK